MNIHLFLHFLRNPENLLSRDESFLRKTQKPLKQAKITPIDTPQWTFDTPQWTFDTPQQTFITPQ